MAERDKIRWYREGLVPAMQQRCATTEQGVAWDSLEKLLLYTIEQESRWKAGKHKSKVLTADVRALETKMKRSFPFKHPQAHDRGITKKPRHNNPSSVCNYCNMAKKTGQAWSNHFKECKAGVIRNLKCAQAALELHSSVVSCS